VIKVITMKDIDHIGVVMMSCITDLVLYIREVEVHHVFKVVAIFLVDGDEGIDEEFGG